MVAPGSPGPIRTGGGDYSGSWVELQDQQGRVLIDYVLHDPFRRLLTDPRFARLPMLLETPKLDTPESRRKSDVDPWDARNLRTLRRLMRKGE